MNLERYLSNGIPLPDAAAFFISVRGGVKQASIADLREAVQGLSISEKRELLKEAVMVPPMAGSTPSPLPATAMGQQTPMPAVPAPTASAAGTQAAAAGKMAAAEKSPIEVGKERAHAGLAAEFERERHRKGERDLGAAMGLLGALSAGERVYHYTKNPIAAVGAAALGHHIFKGLGKEIGSGLDRRHFEKKHAEAFKLALDEMGLQPQPGIQPKIDPATQQYLMAEQQAREAEQSGEAGYLREQLQSMQAAQQAAEQQAQAAQQQAEMLQQQQMQHDQQLQAMQAQVADSTQKSMAAQDQVLQEQQTAAAQRMAFQQLRGTLLEAASQEPPSLTPTLATQDAQQQASQQAGPDNAPAPQQGPAGESPSPGTPPGSPGPQGDQTVSAPSETNQPAMQTAQSTTKAEQQEPTGDAKIPQKEVLSSARRHFLEAVSEVLPSYRPFVSKRI